MPEAIQIVSTFPSKLAAEVAGRVLVERRLVACAQIGGPIMSIYRWQGAIESSEEWTLTLKTRRDRFEGVAAAIRELHSYEVPEIVATAIFAGSEAYLEWIAANVD